METKLQSKQQYPRFIQNKPCGIDKFDGCLLYTSSPADSIVANHVIIGRPGLYAKEETRSKGLKI